MTSRQDLLQRQLRWISSDRLPSLILPAPSAEQAVFDKLSRMNYAHLLPPEVYNWRVYSKRPSAFPPGFLPQDLRGRTQLSPSVESHPRCGGLTSTTLVLPKFLPKEVHPETLRNQAAGSYRWLLRQGVPTRLLPRPSAKNLLRKGLALQHHHRDPTAARVSNTNLFSFKASLQF
ncbi:hypothetical protein Landi51_12346 [Colletotrichum acutatum]